MLFRSPEYPFPTAFQEVYEVGRWTFSQLKKWDADEKRVSRGGHSAGANLTAAVTLKANQTKEFQLCLQVLDYGAFDLATDPDDKKGAADNLIPAERGRMFTEAYTDGDLTLTRDPYCSPLWAPDEMLEGLPEALVVTAGYDNFRFEDYDYAIRMAAAGTKVTLKCYTRSNHGFLVHCTEEWEAGQELVIGAIRQAGL